MKKVFALLLALTLCLSVLAIGAFATGDYWCVSGTMNNWDPNSSDRLTDNGDGTYSITFPNMAANTYEFKFTKNGSWDGCLGGSFLGSGVEADVYSPGTNIEFTLTEASDVTIVLDTVNNKFTLTIGDEIAEAPAEILLHVTVPASWGATYVYVWTPEALGGWPGTYTETGDLSVVAAFAGMVINNGNGTQSWDITDIDLANQTEVWITVHEDGSYTLSYEAPAEEVPEAPIADGDTVKIYYPAGESYISATANDGGKKLLDATEDEAAVWTVAVDENGYYTFTCDGKYLTAGATGNALTLEEAASDYSLWTLEEAENGWYIKNVNASYYEKAQYVEYYSGFTTYGYNANYDSAYVYQFVQVEEPTPEPATIKINVIAEHWNAIYAYVWQPEALGSWPGTLVENGAFEVRNDFAGLVLHNGDGVQTADITDFDRTQTEIWIVVNEDNTFTVSYEAPVVDDPGTNPDGPTTGDAILPGILVLMLSVGGLVTLTSKKRD